MVKTLFQYQGQITSGDLNAAFGITTGYGPICGFGKGTINGSSITLYPYDSSTSPLNGALSNSVRDKLLASNINFALVSKNGALYYNDASSLTVDIEGTNLGNLNEVLVFAHRVNLSQPINNPIEILAFWNNGTSFKPIYNRLYNDDQEVSNTFSTDISISYKSLIDQAKASCDVFNNNESDYTLIGIYGNDFVIIPYGGVFPNSLPLYPGLLNRIRDHIDKLSQMYAQLNSTELGGLNLAEYMTKLIPVGTIVLWAGDEIPKGWREYTPARGRVVVGYMQGGIKLENGQTIYNTIGGTHKNTSELEMRSGLISHYHTISYNTVSVNSANSASSDRAISVISSISSGTNRANTGTPVNSGDGSASTSAYDYALMPSVTLRYIQFVGFNS